MYEEDVDDIALMAIEESEPESKSDFERMEEEVTECKQHWYMDRTCLRQMTGQHNVSLM